MREETSLSPPRRVARACSCPARTPALLPLELGFGSPGPSVPFGPLPWRRGGLRWGFTGSGRGRWEKNPGREKSSFFFPRGKRQGEGGILLAEAASLPSFLPVPPSCPQAPPACLPLPSHLSLALQFESPRVYAAERDGLWLCRCVLGGVLPPPARRQAASCGVLRGGAAVPPRAAALGSLPLPQPWCCSHLAPIASTGAAGARLLSWGRSRCSPLQAMVVSVSHHLPTFCLGWWLSARR